MDYPEQTCPVCGIKHHQLLALCATHAKRLHRTGSPTGRSIRSEELKYYRPIARGLLHKYESEPAIKAIHSLMKSILDGYGADCEMATAGRLARPYLDGLVSAGGTPRSSLIELLALCLWWRCEGIGTTAAEEDMALAKRLLQHKRYGMNHGLLRRRVVASLGYNIRMQIVPTLYQMHAFWERSLAAHDEQIKVARSFNPTF
jgi:hypothetical protein